MKADIAPEHPLYRWYLAGGPQSLRISWSGAGLVFGLGLLAHLAGSAGAEHHRAEALATVLAAAGAVAVAAFTARWIGARKGLLAGFGIAMSLWTLADSTPLDRLSVESIWVALAAFALANVPGRLGTLRQPWVPMLFWTALAVSTALTGMVGPCYVLIAAALYLLATQDSRGVRFLLHVRGIVFMAAVIACLLAARHFGLSLQTPPDHGAATPTSLGTLATTLLTVGLPWIPLALPGLLLVLHEGHCFLPFWRLLACWTVVPIGLAGTGLHWSNACLATVLPPLAVLAAMAADDGLHRLRRLNWFKRRPVRATA